MDIQRLRKYEKEALDEIIEEKKAENRAKTIQIQQVLGKNKETDF